MTRLTYFFIQALVVGVGLGLAVKPMAEDTGIPLETVTTMAWFGGTIALMGVAAGMFIDWRVSVWIDRKKEGGL